MKQVAKVLEQKEEEATNKTKRVEEKRIADAKKVESEKAAEAKEGKVKMEFVDVDNDSLTGREGGVNATTTFPNKGGRGRGYRGDACGEEDKEREEESKEG